MGRDSLSSSSLSLVLFLLFTFSSSSSSSSTSTSSSAYTITLTPSSSLSTQIGKTLNFIASVFNSSSSSSSSSSSIPPILLFPYVNGTQWGAPTMTSSSDGTVLFMIPFTQIGISSIFVSSIPPEGAENTSFLVGLPFGNSTSTSTSTSTSNTLMVDVESRSFGGYNYNAPRMKGMEWEPWFTPLNDDWALAEGTPLVGNYDSMNHDVIRQHALWFMDVGIDFLVVDWTNNLWNTPTWEERGAFAQQLINATMETMTYYATMQMDLYPTPRFVFLLGLDNGPVTPTTALNEEIAFLASYAQEDTYSNLFIYPEGEGPLLLIFDGGNIHPTLSPQINTSLFSVRWMGSQLQSGGLPSNYWSWMDGSVEPIPAFQDGSSQAEALTITNAFFTSGGWLYPGAMGQRNGATLLQEFVTALKYEPQYLILCQWNEFTGQPEGQGGGPNHDQYYDIYNNTFSNDMEPISLSNAGYRSDHGGWGFLYLNLLKALGSIYSLSSSSTPLNFTVLIIDTPENGALVPQDTSSISVTWVSLGGEDLIQGWQLNLDGVTTLTSSDPMDSSFELDTSGLSLGLHTLVLTATGTTTPFPLEDWSQLVEPQWTDPVPVQFQVNFNVV